MILGVKNVHVLSLIEDNIAIKFTCHLHCNKNLIQFHRTIIHTRGIFNNDSRSVELERAAEDVAEDMLDEAAREGVASAAQAALREAKNEELQKRLHHESKMSAAEEVCESIAGEWRDPAGNRLTGFSVN